MLSESVPAEKLAIIGVLISLYYKGYMLYYKEVCYAEQ